VKILQILGVRPHIVKFTPITDKDVICWTGQHYDKELFSDLWHEFNLPPIKYDLGEKDTQRTTELLEVVLKKEKPDYVIVYGDTATTLAGALAAKLCNCKLAHIEAGIRSKFERIENAIRIKVDRLADINYTPNSRTANNLAMDNQVKGETVVVGDPHYDEYIKHREHKNWTLATIHRAEHTDIKAVLKAIIRGLGKEGRVILPAHPRLARRLKQFKIQVPKNVSLIKPVSYRELTGWFKHAKRVITDSGGVTKEAFFAGCPVTPIEIDEWQGVLDFGDGTAKIKIKNHLLSKLRGSKNGGANR
jgi:UDP-N-acetylglucosamine 2-epimerase